jgi:hypothetical protein
MKRMRLGHDDYVERLKQKIEDKYHEVRTFEEYHLRNDGEIDLMGYAPGILDIYEVKCNDGRKRAVEQLVRAKKNFKNNGKRVRFFYYCGRDDRIEQIF